MARRPDVSWRLSAMLETLRPRDPAALMLLVQRLFGLRLPTEPVVEGHDAPADYLVHTFFEQDERDLLVWANRGGGKTMLGAVATMLDLMFKPGVELAILASSFEQSSRMYQYLVDLSRRPAVKGLLAREPTQRLMVLRNGSRVQVLSQSQASVRGVRVQKLRCDEVEQVDPEIWTAAQMVTRSARCGAVRVPGRVEALSTMHRPFGLMSQLVAGGGSRGMRLLRWSAIDVAERCPAARACEPCVLWRDCQGRAKRARGYVAIDDLVRQRGRLGDEAWAAEMLCELPRRDASVYPRFDPTPGGRHVVERAVTGRVVGGMDFGMRSPLVMLWASVGDGPVVEAVVHVFDEHIAGDATLRDHLERIAGRGHARPVWIGIDPAGQQRNDQTGLSNAQVLRRQGYTVRARASVLATGIELVRRRLDHGTLTVSPRCTGLIEALTRYHFDVNDPHREAPVKDGPDHAADALRYLLVNLEAPVGQVRTVGW